MNSDLFNTDFLIRYLDNELSAEEKEALHHELQQNKSLQDQLQNLSITQHVVKNYGLKMKVGQLHQEMMEEFRESKTIKKDVPVKALWPVLLRIAAGLLILVFSYGLYQYATVTPDTVFSNNYQPYSLGTSRSGQSNEVIVKAYQQKDYASVLTQYSSLSSPDQSALFFAGQSYFATRDYANATLCFNKLLALNSSTHTRDFNDDTEYYLALSYLKTNSIKTAYPLLQQIHDNANHLYNDKVSSGVMRRLYFLKLKN